MGASKYKAVVLGAGWRGRGHIQAFLANQDRFDLAAVCDLNTARMGETLAKIGASRPVYASAEEMLAREKPDVFCFATQPGDRLNLVELGIRHGVRAIAYEKPMATSLTEASAICDACDRAGVKQIVCHQHKYGAHWQAVRELVKAGRLGRIRQIHATSKGWYFYYITHLVDYAMWLIDYPAVEWITGHIHGRTKLTDTHPSPDYMLGQVGFANGVRAVFECGPAARTYGVKQFWYDAGLTISGEDGIAQVVVGSGWRAQVKDSPVPLGDPTLCLREIEDTYPHIADLARWLDDDAHGHPCTGRLAYQGFEVSMGILLSALDRRAVRPPVDPSADIVGRMVRELPDSPAVTEGQP